MAQRIKIKKLPFLPTLSLEKANKFLALVFYIIWILIGLFILLFIWANIKQGAFDGLFKPKTQAPSGTQAPNEAQLPGIGTVNVNCVQSSLSEEAISKIIQEGNTSKLTDEEKSKLEPCIIGAEETPLASPAN